MELLTDTIKNISTLPAVIIQIIKTTNNPASSAHDLNKIITKDQAIAAKILQMANSSYYELSGKVKDLDRAITLLGFNTVRTLALSISILDHFKGRSQSGYFNRGQFWEHSMGVAILSKIFAEKRGGRLNVEEAYIGGLLHDLGTIILDQFFHEKFAKILELVYESNIDFLEAEKMVIGIDHAQFGAKIAVAWDYPQMLVSMIGNHHNPEYDGDFVDYCHAVYLGNVFECRFKNRGGKRARELDENIAQKFYTGDEQMEFIEVQFEAEMERNREIIRLFQE